MNVTFPKHSDRSSERGMVLVYVAISIFVLLGLAGLAIDGARLASTSQQLQNAADGAALHAVRYLDSETDQNYPVTRGAAMAIAQANEAAKLTVKLDSNVGNSPTGDIVVGYWDYSEHTFTPTLTAPNAVRVHANRTSTNADGQLGLLIGSVFGKSASDVGATSTAVLEAPSDPLVLILDPTGNGALHINGTNTLDVMAGKVQVNSDNDCGLNMVGTPVMSAALTRVVGGACYPDGAIVGPVQEGVSVVPDPLANVLPDVAAWNAFKSSLPLPAGANGKIAASGTFEPGYYPNGLDATSNEVIHLNPGSYMFGNKVKLAGNAFVTGSGVTLFFDKSVNVDISGSEAGMQLTPPGEGSQFHGIAMFTHRQTTGSSVVKLGGDGVLQIEGVVYVPKGELTMAGTPGHEIGAILAFVAGNQGTTGFIITGKGVPQFSGMPPAAYLVE